MEKFFADVMLSKLGKWLRIIGYECEIASNSNDSDDKEIIKKAINENLHLLTMDKELAKEAQMKGIKCTLIPSSLHSIREQLNFLINSNIVDVSSLDPKSLEERIRCSECGGELRITSSTEKAPQFIRKKHSTIWICNRCGHIYWKGSHWNKIIEFLLSIKKEKE